MASSHLSIQACLSTLLCRTSPTVAAMPPNKAVLYLLLLSSLLPLATSKCCGTKSVGGKEYVLVGEGDQRRLEKLGCLDRCLYQAS